MPRILKWLQDFLKKFYTCNIAYCLVQVRILPSQFKEGTLHGVAVKHIWTYKDEILWRWVKLRIKETQDLCPSQNIIRTNKLRLMRFSGLMAGLGENKNVYIALAGKI
jgi:hypothetical protein